jgi:SAM-dependent methyltransferase
VADVRRPTDVLADATAYRLWQTPFARQKFAPVLKHNDLAHTRRVLDVGCGPGTNTSYFEAADYLGLDLNEAYLAYARRRYGRRFVAADVRGYTGEGEDRFDFILLNSFLHHIDDVAAVEILRRLARLLDPGGFVHILDLVLPAERGLARFLAQHDRGAFARVAERWRTMFEEVFRGVVFEPYSLTLGGVALWHMVYFKGAAK